MLTNTHAIDSFLSPPSGNDSDFLLVPGWEPEDWEALFMRTQRIEVPRGEVLIKKESSERALYLVTSGLFEVTSVLGSQSLGPIAKIRPGSVAGEIAFLDGQPRSATVWAVADSAVQRLDFDAFERLAHDDPRRACDFAIALGRTVALRLRHTFSRQRH